MKFAEIKSNYSTLMKELQIYKEFFPEYDVTDWAAGTIEMRTWSYKWSENSFIASKPVFIYSRTEATLYDYSSLLTIEIDLDNMDDFVNRYGIKIHDLTNENLKESEIKTILANNAKAAIRAELLTKQLTQFKNLAGDFE